MFGKIKNQDKSLERRVTDLEWQMKQINQLNEKCRKLSKKIDLLCSTPPKYKIGDAVWYGENEFEVVDVKICNDYIRYMYDLNGDSHEFSIEEKALYTKKK